MRSAPHSTTNLSFNLAHDIAPGALIGTNAFVLVVTPTLSVKSLREFIAYAKANPGKINMASPGSRHHASCLW